SPPLLLRRRFRRRIRVRCHSLAAARSGSNLLCGRARGSCARSRKPRPAAQALLHEIDALAHAAAAGEAKAGRAPAHLRDIDPADMAADLADIVAQARRLLVEQGLLLTREAALYDAADQPAAKAQTAADQAHLAGAFLEVPFRLAGLQPVVDGFVYEGTPAQIAKAFADADQLGKPAPRTRDAKTGTWHVTSGDARFEIRERAELRAAAANEHSVEHDAPEASSTTEPAITNTKRSSRNLPEYPIRRSSLEVEIQERPGMFRCEFIGRTLQGADVGFGSAMLELTDDGNPKGRPELTLMASYYVNGDEYALHVYDDVVMSSSGVPRGQGVRTSITRYALDEFGRIYEKHFKRPLRVWGGILAWENLLHFQREYVALRRNGMERKQALEAAVKETSFGRHRVEAGFTVLGIDATDDALIDLRDGRVPQLAPTRVEVFARKP
ncbi:MAG TPA: hypothetical protein VFP84_12325, partial [Kofleriaceae bacterium]|nr:hypothetical protein [Kofleriaceae bacterium]